jgi:hypothetical protein
LQAILGPNKNSQVYLLCFQRFTQKVLANFFDSARLGLREKFFAENGMTTLQTIPIAEIVGYILSPADATKTTLRVRMPDESLVYVVMSDEDMDNASFTPDGRPVWYRGIDGVMTRLEWMVA